MTSVETPNGFDPEILDLAKKMEKAGGIMDPEAREAIKRNETEERERVVEAIKKGPSEKEDNKEDISN